MSDYTINNETLAIISCGNDISLVYEGKEMFVINERPNNIIKKNCLKYGSSFEGRLKSAEIITGKRWADGVPPGSFLQERGDGRSTGQFFTGKLWQTFRRAVFHRKWDRRQQKLVFLCRYGCFCQRKVL